MNKTTKLFVLLAVLTLTVSGAFAQRGDGPRGRDGGFFGPRMMNALDLSEEQTADIEALIKDHRAANQDKRMELMRLRHEKRGLMLQDDPKLSDAEALVKKMSALQTEMKLERTKLQFAIRDNLTDEQQGKMMMMKARRGDGPRKERGKRFRDGDCDQDGRQGRRGRN